jgi:hypothetical protein
MITLSLGFRIRNQPVIRWENQMSQNQVGISKSKIWFDLFERGIQNQNEMKGLKKTIADYRALSFIPLSLSLLLVMRQRTSREESVVGF